MAEGPQQRCLPLPSLRIARLRGCRGILQASGTPGRAAASTPLLRLLHLLGFVLAQRIGAERSESGAPGLTEGLAEPKGSVNVQGLMGLLLEACGGPLWVVRTLQLLPGAL